ncbi:MAG TPA: bifunctional isocitrate dehydrogenase kinase/phosphatase [Anaeromyxobacteraceae bacterium]|nr:bifunctional isocitrate dehydrogenase kinase/phosphatase [Anaeromyxobacteraceae bacterium]
MLPEPGVAAQRDLAQWAAETILTAYDAYKAAYRAVTRRAPDRFRARDWHAAQADAVERLSLRAEFLDGVIRTLQDGLGPSARDVALWARVKAEYSRAIASRPTSELAQTFYSSVARRVVDVVGVLPGIEFTDSDPIPPAPEGAAVHRTYPPQAHTEDLLRDLLREVPFDVSWADLDRDARIAAAELDSHLRSSDEEPPLDAIEVLRPVFYRNKGAYVVGRLRRGAVNSPLVLAVLHGERGLELDAILFSQTDANIVFSFTRSYFHVDTDRPRDIVAFLHSIMPQKRTSELYISIGHHKHGKTLLYREIKEHLTRSSDRFQDAAGDRGMVMIVFTLPGLDIVFKVIRDRFQFPKSTTRMEVKQKYQLVFRHDRAGRLVDAQEFEHLAFDASRFTPDLLEELRTEASETVRIDGGRVVIEHLYAERRVIPLNLFIRQADEWSARLALLDYGQAIRDLAVTNTFPGDLLLKNFGVTRSGRVVFYDYDELCLVTDVNFRDLPPPRHEEEETAGEPWFYVGEDDVFPEEFIRFLGLPDRLRDAFVAHHATVLTAEFWRGCQARLRAGEISDIFPYRESQRLWHGR